MGLYNTILSDIRCPNCNQRLEWQSKRITYDGYLLANAMQTIPLTQHISGEIHTSCDECRIFYEVEISTGEEGPLMSSKIPSPKTAQRN